MSAALINHPFFGSLWLENAKVEGNYVVGDAWDDSHAGVPEDYQGEYVPMNFPIFYIRKWEKHD